MSLPPHDTDVLAFMYRDIWTSSSYHHTGHGYRLDIPAQERTHFRVVLAGILAVSLGP